MPLLDVRGLTVSFRARPVDVVTGLSFSIEPGAVFGLAGESGCGKTLTALSVMGILPPEFKASGEILFRGEDLLGLEETRLRRIRGKEIGMVFQEPMTSLNPVMTAGSQIREVITEHLGLSKKEAEEKVIGLLRAVGIPSPELRGRDYPHQLSGGMRQRVMIAMTIACGPSLLIADEPTTALDVTIEAQILTLLRELRERTGMAMLLITHDLGIIRENADHAAVMYAGRLVETSPVGEIFKRPRHPYTMGLLESLPRKRGVALKPIEGAVPEPGRLPPGCKFSDRCRYMKPACRAQEPALREITAGHRARCIRAEEIEWPPS